jgi:hypothetical protein
MKLLIASLVRQLHQDAGFLTDSTTAHLLSAFYCSKLEDFETILPALKGLVSLVKFPSCGGEDAVMIVEASVSYISSECPI